MFIKTEEKKIKEMAKGIPASLKRRIIFNNLWQEKWIFLYMASVIAFLVIVVRKYSSLFWAHLENDPKTKQCCIENVIHIPDIWYIVFGVAIIFFFILHITRGK